jgi:hypothetical protein
MFTNVEDTKVFTLAGNATLTMVSQKTGTRLTFKVTRAKDKQTNELRDMWFVSLLNGPDNENDFAYVGMINGKGQFNLTSRSRFTAETPCVKAFTFFWKYVSQDRMPPQMEVHHEGRCGRCNRKLTVPESIENGLGPECATKMAQ